MPSALSQRLTVEGEQPPGSPDTMQADLLFQGNKEILIAHNGERYRLRVTKNGTLILTK